VQWTRKHHQLRQDDYYYSGRTHRAVWCVRHGGNLSEKSSLAWIALGVGRLIGHVRLYSTHILLLNHIIITVFYNSIIRLHVQTTCALMLTNCPVLYTSKRSLISLCLSRERERERERGDRFGLGPSKYFVSSPAYNILLHILLLYTHTRTRERDDDFTYIDMTIRSSRCIGTIRSEMVMIICFRTI